MKYTILTELYQIEPRDANTPFRESLTSYISRIAEAHSITVGTLINHILGPRLNLVYLTRSSRYGGSRFFDLGYELNGLGKLAEGTSAVITQLCGISSAEELTLLQWRGVFPPLELIRQYKAWCPICLTEWKEISNNVYEPLLWSVKLVDSCTKHKVLLETSCPCCKKRIPVISRRTRNGYCSSCGSWLGNINQYQDSNQKGIEVNSRSYFYSWNVENLLLMTIDVKAPLIFITNVMSSVGGLCAFCRGFGIPKATASTWVNEKSIPSLYMVLSICYGLKLNVEALSSTYNKNSIGICSPILQLRNKQSHRKIDWVSVEKRLVEIIAFTEIPPCSLREVARGLGYDKKLLYKHFPELCKEISARYLNYVKGQKRERISSGERELVHVVNTLNSAGINPSRRKIENLLPCNVSLREEEYKILWKNITHFS